MDKKRKMIQKKHFSKIQHPFIIKSLKKLEIIRRFFNLIKINYENV